MNMEMLFLMVIFPARLQIKNTNITVVLPTHY